jgi:hypothetical protein
MEAAWRLAGFDTSRKSPGVTRLPIHLRGRHKKQYGRKEAPSSDATLLMRYLDRPAQNPRLRDLTYIAFGEQCSIVTHKPDAPLGPNDVLEHSVPGRPLRRIRFRLSDDGVARIQVVYPRHGDVFYLRSILMHRPVSS